MQSHLGHHRWGRTPLLTGLRPIYSTGVLRDSPPSLRSCAWNGGRRIAPRCEQFTTGIFVDGDEEDIGHVAISVRGDLNHIFSNDKILSPKHVKADPTLVELRTSTTTTLRFSNSYRQQCIPASRLLWLCLHMYRISNTSLRNPSLQAHGYWIIALVFRFRYGSTFVPQKLSRPTCECWCARPK